MEIHLSSYDRIGDNALINLKNHTVELGKYKAEELPKMIAQGVKHRAILRQKYLNNRQAFHQTAIDDIAEMEQIAEQIRSRVT